MVKVQFDTPENWLSRIFGGIKKTGYDDWEPPSEATMKLLQARRERSDKISKLMGDYLLKGYKMLGITCPQCDTILLQTKQGTRYCVACSELDSDADKDNPVTNQAAALAQAREREVRESSRDPEMQESSRDAETREMPFSRSAASCAPAARPAPPALTPQAPANLVCSANLQSNDNHTEVSSTFVTPNIAALQQVQQPPVLMCRQGMNVTANATTSGGAGESERYVKDLLDKMDWATAELRSTRSVEYSIQLCELIKGCAKAVSSVKAALDSRN